MKPPAIAPDPANARAHDEHNQQAIRRSLSELGAGRSIVVDAAGTIIGGNETYRQAQALGLKTRIIATRGDELIVVLREDLKPDDPRRLALALADNRANDLSVFDDQQLADLLQQLPPPQLAAAGFTDKDLARLLEGLAPPTPDLPALPGAAPAAAPPIRLAVHIPAANKAALSKTLKDLGGSCVDCTAHHCDVELRRLDTNAWALRRDKLNPQALPGSPNSPGDAGDPD
jgi:hypothetical protein